jgi:tRNA A-37 threonylcarbamoyl transferase component Bud32
VNSKQMNRNNKAELIKRIKELLRIKDEDIVTFKLHHEGYAADSYTLTTKNKKYFIKKFIVKKNMNYQWKFTAKSRFIEETKTIDLLNKIRSKEITTPNVIAKDLKEKILIQKYVEGTSFCKHLVENCNKFYFNKSLKRTFFELGEFLAAFHTKYRHKTVKEETITQLFGDLCGHNMMFVEKDKMFLFDPAFQKGSIYFDLAVFARNFYPYNFILRIILSKKGLKALETSFFKGYVANSKFPVSKARMKNKLIEILKKERTYKTRKLIYVLKKFPVNIYLTILIKRIKSEKIKVYE